MRKSIGSAFLAAALAVLAASGPATAGQVITFTFDEGQTPVGTTTPFGISEGSVGAGFGSFDQTDYPGYIDTASDNGLIAPFSGNALYGVGAPLFAIFTAPVTSVTLDFATAFTGETFTVEYGNDYAPAPYGHVDEVGTVPTGGSFPQGTITVTSPQQFNTIVFGTGFYGGSVTPFAVDNIGITAVPEPSTMALAGLGLAIVAAARLRRRPTA